MTVNGVSQDGQWLVFDDLAPTYEARPTYASAVLHRIAELWEPAYAPKLILDVGAGTGIFTRQLARQFPNSDIVGLEPSAAMREIAGTASSGSVRYVGGTASKLPLAAKQASIVTAASAVHRFDRPAFLIEAARVLEAGGLLAMVDNLPRPWGARFHNAYLELQEELVPEYRRGRNSDGSGGYVDLDLVGDLLPHSEFETVTQDAWPFDAYLDLARLLALAASSSINQVAIAAIGPQEFTDRLRRLHRDHTDEQGLVRMSFLTVATFAHRAR